MDEFISKMTEILEVPGVSRETKFRETEDWDSMKGFAILIMLERDYAKRLTVPEFMSMDTVDDIAKVVGL